MYNNGMRLWTAVLLLLSLGPGSISFEQPSTPAAFGTGPINNATLLSAGLFAEASTLRPSWAPTKKAPSVTASTTDGSSRQPFLLFSKSFDDDHEALIREASRTWHSGRAPPTIL
jgi:hypothetical protein